jgi:phage-related minor tail protein
VIPAAKATRIRKEVMKLDHQYNELHESLSYGKKEMDAVKDTVKNKLDSMTEMGEMESLRLQMAMDRLSKMMSTLSNLLKKISDTASDITQNLK